MKSKQIENLVKDYEKLMNKHIENLPIQDIAMNLVTNIVHDCLRVVPQDEHIDMLLLIQRGVLMGQLAKCPECEANNE